MTITKISLHSILKSQSLFFTKNKTLFPTNLKTYFQIEVLSLFSTKKNLWTNAQNYYRSEYNNTFLEVLHTLIHDGRGYFRNRGQRPENTRRTLFHYKKSKKGAPLT